MGLMRWLRGGDDNTAATSVVSAGLAEIDGLFRPSKHKQTEHVEQQKRRRVDVSNSGGGIDLDRGVAVIRTPRAPAPAETLPEPPAVRDAD
jgi:Family of unknown function (DUF6191)